MLSVNKLISVRGHFDGEQRIYRYGQYGLSVVNPTMLHHYPYAWEAAVIKFDGASDEDFSLVYDTPLTDDVVVFQTDEETEEFLQEAFTWFSTQLLQIEHTV